MSTSFQLDATHRTEQLGLIRQHRNVGNRRRAIGHRDHHVDQHPTPDRGAPGLPQASQCREKLPGQRVGCQNSAMAPDQRLQAAASYSLRNPPKIGRRRIRP